MLNRLKMANVLLFVGNMQRLMSWNLATTQAVTTQVATTQVTMEPAITELVAMEPAITELAAAMELVVTPVQVYLTH